MPNRRYRIDLPAHMAECDANYLRLMKLFPRLREDDAGAFGIPLGEHPCEVHLRVLERGPYTTAVELRQISEKASAGVSEQASKKVPADPWHTEPRLRIRLYHDARSAEVVEYHGARHFRPVYDYPNHKMHLPDEKAQLNRLLSEFLSMCLAHGVAISELAPTD